jgi:hypothetical protein
MAQATRDTELKLHALILTVDLTAASVCGKLDAMLVLAVLVSALLLLWFGAALILDIVGRRASAHGIFDVIVVPGCRVLEDGGSTPPPPS